MQIKSYIFEKPQLFGACFIDFLHKIKFFAKNNKNIQIKKGILKKILYK